MKKYLLLLTALMAHNAWGQQLTAEDALSRAMEKMAAGTASRKCMARGENQASQMKLVFTEQSQADQALYYVFGMPQGGFVIAGADNRAEALLGYTDDGDFASASQNPAFSQWLADCTSALERLSHLPVRPTAAAAEDECTTAVAPLLGDIKWDQETPYNNLCPIRSNEFGHTKHARTGCVITATTQIMRYYQWPSTGVGTCTNDNEPSQTVDFSQSTYDWEHMKPSYRDDYTDVEGDAVAKLMYDVGCALNANYQYGGTGANTKRIASSLANYFCYDKGIRYINRKNHSSREWKAMLRNELDHGRPFAFSSEPFGSPGHCWVIDGYDTNGLYHMNWGWSGRHDGYFDIDYFCLDNLHEDFCYHQEAIINIIPDRLGTSTAQTEMCLTYLNSPDYANEISYRISNYGQKPFDGDIIYLLKDDTGKEVYTRRRHFAEYPLDFFPFEDTEYFDEADSIRDGYVFTIMYSDEPDGEPKEMLHPVSMSSRMMAYSYDRDKIFWYPILDELPEVNIVDTETIRNYAGYAPIVRLTLTNDTIPNIEYNSVIYVRIFRGVSGLYCGGWAQVYLNPGETTVVDVVCDRGKVTQMEPGEYDICIFYYFGEKVYCDDKTFSIVLQETPPCDLTYSSFGTNKADYTICDVMEATFQVTNTGGYCEPKYCFDIFPATSEEPMMRVDAYKAEIYPDTTSTVVIKKNLDLAPGNYYGIFYQKEDDNLVPIDASNRHYFSVGQNATGLHETEASDGKAEAIYNLQGQRVKQMTPGRIYMVNGRRVMYNN